MTELEGPLLTPEQQQELNRLKVHLKIQNERYLRSHPEVSIVLSRVVESLLEEKPTRENILPFIEDFFDDSDLQQIVAEHNKKMEAERTSEPLTGKGLTKYADTLMQQHEWEKAVQFYSKALQVVPNDPEVYYKRGYIQHKYLKEYEKAFSDYSRAIETKPIHAEAYRGRGDLTQYIKQDPTKAILDYDLAIAFGLNTPKVFSCRGDAKRKTNDIIGAEEDILMGLQLAPNNATCKHHHALLLHLVKQDHKKALEEYTLAIELGITEADIFGHRGEVYFRLKDYDNAIQDMEVCINKAGNDTNSSSNTVNVEDMKDKLDEIKNQQLIDEKSKATRQYGHLKQKFPEISFDGDLMKQECVDLLHELAEMVKKFRVVKVHITCTARQQEIADIRSDSVRTNLGEFMEDMRFEVTGTVGESASVNVRFV